ncbi:arylformamidase [Bacillus piscicola]|uniref:arylformamidase n=1 Tax=Bacillus piscicola TaxID=1632684 RepID=UPI001F099922|nr:arylformamidase [Bacillus piscicola]
MTKQEWIDITQPLTDDIGHWPGDIPFSYRLTYPKEQTGSVNIGQMTTSLHTGTHADAPFHFDNEGKKIDELDVNIYIGPTRVVDVTGVKRIGSHELSQFDLTGVNRLLLRTTKDHNPNRFPANVPEIQEDAGPFLKEKGIFLLGVDVPSIDALDSKTMTAHHSLHANGIHILENLLLAGIKPGEYELIALPMLIKGADGSPVRAVIRPLRAGNRTQTEE